MDFYYDCSWNMEKGGDYWTKLSSHIEIPLFNKNIMHNNKITYKNVKNTQNIQKQIFELPVYYNNTLDGDNLDGKQMYQYQP